MIGTKIFQFDLLEAEKLSYRKFSEFFKTHPTFVLSPFQSGDIDRKPRTCVFLGHPVFSSDLSRALKAPPTFFSPQSCPSPSWWHQSQHTCFLMCFKLKMPTFLPYIKFECSWLEGHRNLTKVVESHGRSWYTNLYTPIYILRTGLGKIYLSCFIVQEAVQWVCRYLHLYGHSWRLCITQVNFWRYTSENPLLIGTTRIQTAPEIHQEE